MNSTPGINGPDRVEEGSTEQIEVDAPESDELTITVSNTGQRVRVRVEQGKARFPLPSSARAGAVLIVADSKTAGQAIEIDVVPGTDD